MIYPFKEVDWVRLIVIGSITLILSAYLVEIFIEVSIFDQGDSLLRVQILIDEQREDNMILQAKLAQEESLESIEARAKALGFVPYENVLYIKGGD